MLDLLIPTVAQGLLWALMALGVYITFRVLDIADLSVEGTFPLGAAVASTVLASGYGVGTAFILAAVTGAPCGRHYGAFNHQTQDPGSLGRYPHDDRALLD